MLTLLLLIACTSSPEAPTEVAEAAPPAAAETQEAKPARTLGTLEEIDVKELHTLLEKPEEIVLIDVRTDPEYARGHVPGAIHIPMEKLMASTEPLAPYKDKPVYLICHSGSRSSRVAQRVVQDGYNAVNVAGGTAAWQAAGYPVE